MAATIIEGHLASFISTSEVDINSFLRENELDEIKQAITKLETHMLKPNKEHFEEKYTYTQLRMAVAHLNR